MSTVRFFIAGEPKGSTQPETWKAVIGYEGAYDVSDIGRVRRSPHSRRIGNVIPGRIISSTQKSNGYMQVSLCFLGSEKSHMVHRLVAEAFIGKASPEMQVNHKNGDKADNRLENLEFTTPAQNMNHCVRTGLYPSGSRNGSRTCPHKRPRGERNSSAKLTAEQVLQIRAQRANGSTLRSLASKYGVAISNIESITKFRTWKEAA